MTTIAYLDPVGGASGDMVVGSLLDAGAPQDVLHGAVSALGLDDVKLEVARTARSGVAATAFRVIEDDHPGTRPAAELRATLDAADLRTDVKARATRCLDRLIAAESAIHDLPPDRLMLHEVSGADTLVDIVGAFALLAALGVDEVISAPLPFARTVIASEHGPLPGPGPAVIELALGFGLVGVEGDQELVTPTGAAIVTTAATRCGTMPPIVTERIGYGAGARELPGRPNLLRVLIGRPLDDRRIRTQIVTLAANLDDLLPELVPDVVDACFGAGALDVWTTPAAMKKGRPGITLTALAPPEAEAAVAGAMLAHSSTLGVRVAPMERYELERAIREVRVGGLAIRVKLGFDDGRLLNVAPEHDDCAAASVELGLPVKQVWGLALREALGAWGHDAGPR
jgi:uncharacterized protein (TIGR00299 family) protein